MNHKLIFLACIFCVLAIGLPAANSQASSSRISILHFNDLHGYVFAHRGSSGRVGGIARIQTLIHQIKQENRKQSIPTLVLFAGDLLQGAPISSVFHGKVSVLALNQLEINAATVGNHEFDFGQDNFNELIKLSKFPWIVSNIRRIGAAAPILEPTITLPLANGLRIGIIGITTDELLQSTLAKNVNGLQVDDPIVAIKNHIKTLDEKSDMVIVLSHCGINCDRNLAKEIVGIDLIIGGHNEVVFPQPVVANNIPIVQAGHYGEYLGRADILIENDVTRIERYRIYPITEDIAEDQQLKEQMTLYQEQIAGIGKQIIGNNKIALDGRRTSIRRKNSNLGNFTCDLVRQRFGSDIVLLNGGGFRASINQGDISIADVLAVFPFGNSLVNLNVSGSVIKRAIEHGLKTDPLENPGSFLQISGIKFQIDNQQPLAITVNNKPLDDHKIYSLTINDFMAQGGDGFTMFEKLADKHRTGYTLADLVIAHIIKEKIIEIPEDNRIQRISPWSK